MVLILVNSWPHPFLVGISALKGKIILFQDNFKECNNLVGGLSVIVDQELGSGNVNSFSCRDIDIKVFDIKS
jgi:hypothetical protein